MDMNETILRIVDLTKSFGDVVANDEISIDVLKGEIHCLLGENGSGKTTLAECIYGLYQADSGRILFEEESINISSPRVAIQHGIGMVHQHFVLVRPLSVLENIVAGTDALQPILNLRRAKERIERICLDYQIELDLTAKIWQLSVGKQQWVEILKAIFAGVKLLILDEPTAVLTPQETDNFFDVINQMKSEGISIIFITHKLREVIAVADRVTVLRKGKKVATVSAANLTETDLAEMMVGRNVVFRVKKGKADPGDPILEIKNLYARDNRARSALQGISFTIRKGEIVGIAGVSGNGQLELFESLIGMRKIENGKVLLDGVNCTNKSPRFIYANGLAHIPEDRLIQGLVPAFSIAENLMLGLHKDKFFWHGVYLNKKDLTSFALKCIDDYGIANSSPSLPTKNLSGGNLQRVVLARELSINPKCLIVNQPTRGLDVGAIEYVHEKIIEQRDNGVGILLISEELDEIFALSDRILVFFQGKIVGDFSSKEARIETIGALMTGGSLEGI